VLAIYIRRAADRQRSQQIICHTETAVVNVDDVAAVEQEDDIDAAQDSCPTGQLPRTLNHPDRHDRALGQTLAWFSEAPATFAIGGGTTYGAYGLGLEPDAMVEQFVPTFRLHFP
jgi:hypothetical protein